MSLIIRVKRQTGGCSKIRGAIVHLHQRVLGRYEKPDSPAVERSYKLFAALVAEAAERAGRFVEHPPWWARTAPAGLLAKLRLLWMVLRDFVKGESQPDLPSEGLRRGPVRKGGAQLALYVDQPSCLTTALSSDP